MSFISPQWPSPKNVRALLTTRSGGNSKAPYESLNLGVHVGDKAIDVLANRAILRKQLPAEPIWLNQTHGTLVSTPQSRIKVINDVIHADAAVTNNPNEVLVIMTADCLPVLITSLDGSVIGAAHAGWRGLCAGVLENTIAEMLKLSAHLQAQELIAWLGPAIGPEAFEVGEDVVNEFLGSNFPSCATYFKPINGKPGKYLANIYQLAHIRLEAMGLISISGGDRCTVKEAKEFFSYRRDGVTGRFASLIWISK